MASNLLASASTTVVKVWDFYPSVSTTTSSTTSAGRQKSQEPVALSFVEVLSFHPFAASSARVNVARWSHDNVHLAVAGNEGHTVSVHDLEGGITETLPRDSSGGNFELTEVNALRFADKSRCILYAGDDHVVHAWDRIESRFLAPLKGHRSAITSLALDKEESCVASASTSGMIIVHNRESLTASTLNVQPSKSPSSTSKSINVMEYSYYRAGLLAAAGEDGCVRLWDTTASTTALQKFDNSHNASIKGIAFSPVNRYLMCTASLDKRIVLYDVEKKEKVKALDTDEPLTALSFKADGVTLAAGTMGGNIAVYDLRSTARPMCLVLGHEPHAIQTLHFQEQERKVERRASGKSSAAASRPLSRSTSIKSPSAGATSTQPLRSTSLKSSLSSSGNIMGTKTRPERARTTPSSTHRAAKSSTPPPGGGNGYMKMFSPVKANEDSVSSGASPPAAGTDFPKSQSFDDSLRSSSLGKPRGDGVGKGELGGDTARRAGDGVSKKGNGIGEVFSPPVSGSADCESEGGASLVSQAIWTQQNWKLTGAILNRTGETTTITDSPIAEGGDDLLPSQLRSHGMKSNEVSNVGTDSASLMSPPPVPSPPAASSTSALRNGTAKGEEAFSPIEDGITGNMVSDEAVERIKARIVSRVVGAGSSLTAPVTANDGECAVAEVNAEEGRTPGMATTASGFQQQLLENLIDECLQEFRAAVRQDVQNVHLELLRQFHIQKNDIERMFLKYCGTAQALQEEVERLRDENHRLRLNY